MSRIDIHTLVACFEKRIEALEKNPPDKVPMKVILDMMEKSIDEEIKNHFVFLAQKEMTKIIKQKFQEKHKEFIDKTLEGILNDESFRKTLEKEIKDSIIFKTKLNRHI